MFNNKIFKIDKNGKRKRVFYIKGLKIKFYGKNSTIILHEPCLKFKNSSISCSENSHIEIGASNYKVRNIKITLNGSNNKLNIGKNFFCNPDCKIILQEENQEVLIGQDCMFAQNVTIRASDGHQITDSITGKVLNKAENIVINDHCWIGMNAVILKNTLIAKNSIVAAGAIVSKNLTESNSIYAGIPAKIVRSNVNWHF